MPAPSNPSHQTHAVQACITNVSFPQTLDGLTQMLHKNRGFGHHLTDLDLLLQFRSDDTHAWTAARWMMASDILFFFHAASAGARIARLIKEAQHNRQRDLVHVLTHAAQLAQTYSGTIFGCAPISDAPMRESLNTDERHFQNRIFAPFTQFHRFEHPLLLMFLVKPCGLAAKVH